MDSLFIKGDSHLVCQDWSLTFNSGAFSCLIVADGCSSSKQTDVGARFLALTAKLVLSYSYGSSYIGLYKTEDFKEKLVDNIIYNLKIFKQNFQLDDSVFDATLLISIWDNNLKEGITFCFGDGLFIYKVNNNLCYTIIEYDSNAPYYLSYKLNKDRNKEYLEQYKNSKMIIKNHCNEEISQYYSKFNVPFSLEVLSNNYSSISMVGIASDGLMSFEKDKTPVALNSIINPFFEFKNTNGEYLKRRIDKYLKQLNKEGYSHYDDISIATLLIKD